MKNTKLYNVFFPIWLIMMIPPFVLVAAAVNLIIDGAVILIMLYLKKAEMERKELLASILSAWGFGMLTDYIGMLILLFIGMNFDFLEVYNVWKDPLSLVVYIIVIASVGWIIFKFNYNMFLKKGLDGNLSQRIGVAMGVITAPWTFLIPSNWLY